MRARNIKPGFFKNEQLAAVPFEWRLLFIGLWCLADREGRLEDRPIKIRMELFPADDVDCDAGLETLHKSGLIHRYSTGGCGYIWIPTFREHQNPHPREAKSVIPQALGIEGDASAIPRHDLGNTLALPSRADVLNPDVLNPESKPSVLETPGRGKAPRAAGTSAGAVVDELRVTPSACEEPGLRGELHALCAANNVRANAMHPQLVEWARAGITTQQLREAIVQARISKPPDIALNPAYLAPIVERVLAGNGSGTVSQAWKTDDDAAVRTGTKLGVKPKPGEDFHAFRRRIGEAIANQARRSVA